MIFFILKEISMSFERKLRKYNYQANKGLLWTYKVADALATSLTPTYPFKQLKSQETPDLSFFAKYVQNLSYSKTSQLEVKVKAIILSK